jgi:hypothetical protein
MSARIGFRIGPFYFSQRLGRTQAEKRAAAKARQARAKAAEYRRAVMVTSGVVTGHEPGKVVICVTGESGPYRRMITGCTKAVRTGEVFPVGTPVEVRERARGQQPDQHQPGTWGLSSAPVSRAFREHRRNKSGPKSR